MSDAEALFEGKDPQALETYRALVRTASGFGPFEEEAKKTSIHLARKSAFAGVHPRKSAVLLVLRTRDAIDSGRIRKRERVSANRWHNEMLLSAPAEVDAEVTGWLREAYALSGGEAA